MGWFLLLAVAAALLTVACWFADGYLTPLVLVLADGREAGGWHLLSALWPVAAILAGLAVVLACQRGSYRHDATRASLEERDLATHTRFQPVRRFQIREATDRLRHDLRVHRGRRRSARRAAFAALVELAIARRRHLAAQRQATPDRQSPEAPGIARLLQDAAAREARLAAELERLERRRDELTADARRRRIRRPPSTSGTRP